MKIAVLGGCGIQGRTAIHDLSKDSNIQEIICADIDLDPLDEIRGFTDMSRITGLIINAYKTDELLSLFKQVDVVIDLLPKTFMSLVCQAAIQAGISVVNTNYGYEILNLDNKIKDAGIAFMPECGLDPGIDLVIYGAAKKHFDKIRLINSYCGGFPEKNACNNPINYKLSWIWSGVLSSLQRDSRIIRNGELIEIPAKEQHYENNVHMVDFPGIGQLEATLNGNAVFFTDMLGVTQDIRETGRYSLRWPGWSAFWRPLKQFGFLDDTPVKGLNSSVTPMEFIDKLMGPQLIYGENEKDMVAMMNIFEGEKNNKQIRMTSVLTIERDIETGLMGMSKGVGYPACIAAKMIARGEIDKKGILSPIKDIPFEPFKASLEKRGIKIKEKFQEI